MFLSLEQLCCELGKGREWRAVVIGELVLADHVSHFDPFQGG